MNYDSLDILLLDGIEPRKTVYWTGIVRPNAVEIKDIDTENGRLKYAIAIGAFTDDRKPITDFRLLYEVLKIGKHFSEQYQIKQYDSSANSEIISSFIQKNGFPFLSPELREMPKQETIRQKSLSNQEFLFETDSWSPHDGCLLLSFILSAMYLFFVWNAWREVIFCSSIDEYANKQKLLQQCIEHGNWSYSIKQIDVMYKPSLTHTLKFDPICKRYIDRYESANLLCIVTDQLYSFIADYESGKYSCIKECPICGRAIRISRNQKYCTTCADEVRTQKTTVRSRKYRQRHKTDTKPTPASKSERE